MFYVLHNGHGMSASFSDYGARWTGFSFPDAAGCPGNVVLGFENESDYACAGEQYHGAIVGRVCGRTFPFFELEGTAYRLSSNDSLGSDVKNHLHGGFNAFHNRTWTGKFEDSGNGEESVVFSLFSPDGDEEEARLKLQKSLEELEQKAPKAFDEVYKFGIWRRKK